MEAAALHRTQLNRQYKAEEFAEQARLLLDQAMTTAFAEVFPGAPLRGLVAARIGDTCAATKKKGVKDDDRPIQLHPRTYSPNRSSDHANPPDDA